MLVLTSLGKSLNASSAIASSLIRAADADFDRSVDVDEFVAYILSKSEDDAKNAEGSLAQLEAAVLGERFIVARAASVFRKLDLDGDGSLTPSELMALLQASGESEADALKAAQSIVDAVDLSSNKAIELDEFLLFIRSQVRIVFMISEH